MAIYDPKAIYNEVLAFIHAPKQARFESLALHVFRHQFDTIAPYREYCLAREARPDDVRSLDQIPALSTAAFKYAELTDTVTPLQPAGARVFMTSGTTAGRDERGRQRAEKPSERGSEVCRARREVALDGGQREAR